MLSAFLKGGDVGRCLSGTLRKSLRLWGHRTYFGRNLLPWVMVLLLFSYVSSWSYVDTNPWGPTIVTRFDPAHPPTNPPLPTGAAADCTPVIQGAARHHGTWNPSTGTYEVKFDSITLSGHSEIRLPYGASANLEAHEHGHDSLNMYEYDKRAKEKMEDAFKGFVGSKFIGVGATDSARHADAEAQATAEMNKRADRAMEAIEEQMDVLNNMYDDFTAGGLSQTCNAAQGVDKAKRESDKANWVGDGPLPVDPNKQNGGSQLTPKAQFDEQSQNMIFGGDGTINFALNNMDPIIGYNEILVDDLVLVGVKPNGTIRLSDTKIDIIHSMTMDTLLDGYLLEATYILGQYGRDAGQLQAYLEIPFGCEADGINNWISSDLLAGLETGTLYGQPTMFWFFPLSPLFDSNGTSLMTDSGIPGTIVLGMAQFLCGDANASGIVNVLDITYVINFLYKGGPMPIPLAAADVNSDGLVRITDITYLINFLYKHGHAPFCR